MKFTPFYIMVLTVMKMAIGCFCQAQNNESYFIREILMKNYDPLVRPVYNSSHATTLTISIGLKTFIDLDMKKQTFASFAWLSSNWYDEFLRWDQNQYPFSMVHFNGDMVWRPDLVIYNTVNDLDQLENMKRKLIVEHTGRVSWFPGGLFQTFCSVNIFRYPLDTQTCTVQVAVWSYNLNDLIIDFKDPAFDSGKRTEQHPEWTLVDQKATRVLQYYNSHLEFTFTIKRKSQFYILNMILPISLLSLMNCLVFLLPVESGEKMTVSVTMFLSLAVFLSVINDSLPPNSDSVCLFSVYVAVQMFLSVCYTIIAAFIVFVYKEDNDSSVSSQCQSSSDAQIQMLGTMSIAKRPSRTVTAEPDKSARNKVHPALWSSESSQLSQPQHQELSLDGDCVQEIYGEKSVRSQEKGAGSMSVKRVWLMLISVHRLTPEERRLLSQQLDKVCLKVSLVTNVIVYLVFGCILTLA